MEALAEQIVATYLTRGGKVFIAPQYAIPNPHGRGDWSCPDFVALDFERSEVVVVEVATGWDLDSVLTKVRDREMQWFSPLRAKLRSDKIMAAEWPIRFLGFVRKANLERASKSFLVHADVKFTAIEGATFAWEYWEARATAGLPR